jgi:hypothetical protein
MNGEKLIAQMLHEMDMSQLEQYLFDPRREISASDMIDKYLSVENIESMTKDEIMTAIQHARPESVWDKHFVVHIEIEDLQSKMGIIRNNRNKVAHCKPFYSKDFYDSMTILKTEGLINKLTNAIEKLETRELSLVTKQDVYNSLVAFGNFFKAAAIIVSPALIEFASFMQSIYKNLVWPVIINPLAEALEKQNQINRAAMNPMTASAFKQAQAISKAVNFAHLNTLSKQIRIAESLTKNPLLESLQRAEQLNKLYNPSLLEALRRGNAIKELTENTYMMNEYIDDIYINEENTNDLDDENENKNELGNDESNI